MIYYLYVILQIFIMVITDILLVFTILSHVIMVDTNMSYHAMYYVTSNIDLKPDITLLTGSFTGMVFFINTVGVP